MDNLILLILGLFISVLGITNIKGNISTIHSYNRRKVKEEDIPKYGKVVGTGTAYNGSIFYLRVHCFVLERDRYGSYHPTGSSCWFGIYALWTVQI